MKYRSPEEIEAKKLRDPLMLWRNRLIEEGLLEEVEVERILEQAMAEANEAAIFADHSPAPTVSDLTQDVYWETDHATVSSKLGRHFFDD
jgi:pyruvate dehydrogenase E1 component alpha subunit